jgi:ubiquinone/menaquinone biosynthesis C-methylase UbiE
METAFLIFMEYYDKIADGYDELHKEEQLKKARIIKDSLDIKKTDYLLDVGTGTGFALELFDCRKVGIDPSPKLLKKARTPVIKGKAESLPFPDKIFDIVISITAIHHFDDIEKGLKEMKRVAKDKVAFSLLKKSKKFEDIKKLIKKNFKIEKEINEGKDLVMVGKV